MLFRHYSFTFAFFFFQYDDDEGFGNIKVFCRDVRMVCCADAARCRCVFFVSI